MRKRAIFPLVTLGALIAISAAVVALSKGHGSPASGVVTVDVPRVRSGDVVSTSYTASVANLHAAPVFVVDVPHEGYVALVGRSTHLGCRVEWVHAAGYRRFENHPDVVFEDPCGGSLFALNGECIGGPCPRGLDRFAVATAGAILRINLRETTTGQPRDPEAQLSTAPAAGSQGSIAQEPTSTAPQVACVGGRKSDRGPNLIGTLRMIGATRTGLPVAGDVSATTRSHLSCTVSVGNDGKFSLSLPPGMYDITGHSPSYEDGKYVCTAEQPVVVHDRIGRRQGATPQFVTVACPVR